MSTTELERRPLTPLDIGETKAAQKLYQDGLVQLLDRAADLTPIRGQGGKVKNHVNRSGVRRSPRGAHCQPRSWASRRLTVTKMARRCGGVSLCEPRRRTGAWPMVSAPSM